MTQPLREAHLWRLVERRAAETPDAPMLVDEAGTRLTFDQYRRECEAVAASLHSGGVGRGTVVSWQLPNWIDSVVLIGALSRLGAVQNPIAPLFRQREVGFITGQLGTRVLVVPTEWRGHDYGAMARSIASSQPQLSVVEVEGALDRTSTDDLPAFEPWLDPQWVLYTSGTTSDPKGARHTDLTFQITAGNIASRMHMSAADRNSIVFPLAHIGGVIFVFANLMYGSCSILVERFGPDSVEVLSRESATVLGSGLPFYREYIRAQRGSDEPIFPDLRVFVGGGATRPPGIHDELKAVFGVGLLSGYGLTEVGSFTKADLDDPDDARALSEGRAYDGTELRIVGPDGAVLGPDEIGEVRGRGPQVMVGYVDSTLDADAFDDDGFFRSGDLGYLDERGFLYITGRIKDVIIRKAENISAREVEDLLYLHPDIEDAAVIGLPDEETGERACAVLVLRPGGSIGLEDLRAFLLAQGLAIQKVPEQIELVDDLPRTVSGKAVKHELQERYRDRPFTR